MNKNKQFQFDAVKKRYPLVYKASNYFRNKRFNLFLKLFSVQRDTKILDVGGTFAFWENLGFEDVTLLNVEQNVISNNKIKSIKYGGRDSLLKIENLILYFLIQL